MKKQNIKQIKFRSQYLYLVSELIDNAFFIKKDFAKVCLIDTGFFSNKVIKLANSQFNNLDIITINSLNNLKAKEYDLILAPVSLQFISPLKYNISILHDSLKPEGILLASGFNVLSSADSIMQFKEFMLLKKLKASLVNFFALGELLNTYSFKDKALDRENILIEGNKIELINVFCLKKESKNTQNSIKIEIN